MIQGLLLNSRMVQGIFVDGNPATRKNWAYLAGSNDPERNTREFIAAMAEWQRRGLRKQPSYKRALGRLADQVQGQYDRCGCSRSTCRLADRANCPPVHSVEPPEPLE